MKKTLLAAVVVLVLPAMGSAYASEKIVGLSGPIDGLVITERVTLSDPFEGLRPEGYIQKMVVGDTDKSIVSPKGNDRATVAARPEGGDGRNFRDRIKDHVVNRTHQRGASSYNVDWPNPEARKV